MGLRFPTLLHVSSNDSVEALRFSRTVKDLVTWFLSNSVVAPLGDNIEPDQNPNDEYDSKNSNKQRDG